LSTVKEVQISDKEIRERGEGSVPTSSSKDVTTLPRQDTPNQGSIDDFDHDHYNSRFDTVIPVDSVTVYDTHEEQLSERKESTSSSASSVDKYRGTEGALDTSNLGECC